LLLALSTTPALAGPVPHTSSHSLSNDRDAKTCTHNGLPCSTISMPSASATKADAPAQQLDLIERQSLNTFKSASPHEKAPGYRPASVQQMKQPAAEFKYHSPNTRH
jgi:hypothetical protein